MKKVISTEKAPKSIATYSQAIEARGLIFISGQIAIDPATGKLVEGGIREQTGQAMKNIGAILRKAGCGFEHVVKSTCLITDMSNYAEMNAMYGLFFPKDPPARAAYAVAGLPMGALVEIETIAYREAPHPPPTSL